MRNFRKLFKSLINPKRIIVLDLDELKNDESYKYAWQANIAMAIKDEFCRFKVEQGVVDHERFQSFSDSEMHLVANKGAIRFLNQLTHVSK